MLWMTYWGFGFKSYDLKTTKFVINSIIGKLINLLFLDHNF